MMPNLFEIIYKAYRHTKNHKFLWFFGFFLTWGGLLNFVRFLDYRTQDWTDVFASAARIITQSPFLSLFSIIGGLIVIFAAMCLGAISRVSLIWAGLHLERKERITMKLVLGGARKSFWRVLGVGALVNFATIFVLLWLGVPTLYIFAHGYVFRGIMISFMALFIYTPLVIALSMINIFAACFIVVYDFKFKDAIKSGTDLFAGYWDRTIGLMFVLLIIYVFLFVVSASVVGLLTGLAYFSVIVLKSFAMPFFVGTLTTFLVLLFLGLIVVNAILNVFNNLAWTLFFLRIVKAKRFPEEEASAAESWV